MGVAFILNYSRYSIVGIITLPVFWLVFAFFFVIFFLYRMLCMYCILFETTIYFENKTLFWDCNLRLFLGEAYTTGKFWTNRIKNFRFLHTGFYCTLRAALCSVIVSLPDNIV